MDAKTERAVPLKSHNITYPFIAPPIIILGSFGLNSNDSISRGDYNNKTGSIEWISSKSQNTIKDLCDFNYEITLSSNNKLSTNDSATIYFDLIA